MFATTLAQAWTAIEQSFAARTTARSSQIRSQLSRVKKLDSTAAAYYTLASIGQPLHPDEFQNYLLDGLDEDYDNLVETIKNRDDPLPDHDLLARLLVLSTEQRLESRRSVPLHSAHAAKTGGRPSRPSGPPTAPSTYRQAPPSAPASRPTYSPRPTTRGGGGSLSSEGR
jgi:hypothetical protein